MHIVHSFLFLSFLPLLMYTNHDHKHTINVLSDQYRLEINKIFPDNFQINTVVYDSESTCDSAQLMSVAGFQDHLHMSKQELLCSLFYLRQLGQFKKIFLNICKNKDDTFSLKFDLEKNYTLFNLSITGFSRDKQRYKNMYLIDIGDVFDEQKHQHSLDIIKKSLCDIGYFQAQVHDRIDKDVENKTINIALKLKSGVRFHINDVFFELNSNGDIPSEQVAKMQRKIVDLYYFRLHAKPYSDELIQRMQGKMKVLLEKHGFINFEIIMQKDLLMEHRQINLTFKINLDRKRELIILGNSFFSREQIVEQLFLYGKSAWHFPSSIMIDEIVQLYKNKGFFNVQVSIREEMNRVFCLIQEGQRALITSVGFKGNRALTTENLIKTNFLFFLKTKFFDKDNFKKSIEQLLKSYRQVGFWDAKIIKEEFVPAKKNEHYEIVLTIDEGRQRILGTIQIPGYHIMQDQLLSAWRQKIGKGFDMYDIQEQKQWILRSLRSQGYLKAVVDYRLQDDQQFIHVVWNISLQESEVKFGKTIILGNTVLPYNSLMREVDFAYGDLWDKKKIEQTLKNLRELHVFESVQIYPGRDVDENLCKPIFIKLIHGDRYEVRTRFGLQQVGKNFQFRRGFTYKLGSSFLINNPFHQADRFMFQADVTRFYRDLGATYEFPWLFGRKIRSQFKLYDTLYDQPVYFGSQISLYQATQQGFLWNMAHVVEKYTLSGTAGLEFMGLKQADQPQLSRIIDYDEVLLGKKIAYVFIEPNIVWQRVDSLLNPQQGHLSFISCKAMVDLDSKTTFFKLLVEHSQYILCSQGLSLAIRLRVGHVFNRHFNQLHPIERFYLGGASSLRGYERDYCPPFGLLTCPIFDQHAGLPPCANDIWRYAPQGGRSMMNANVEARFTLYNNLGGVIFSDFGGLFKDSIYIDSQNTWDHFFAGSGFGIRYNTPIGPLRFDVGFKWKRLYQDFESRCVWYLTLGQAF